MRSIQDPKKRKLTDKGPVVTSQDPDFPESLLGGPPQKKIDWLLNNGFHQRPNDGKNSRTALEWGTNNTHTFITPPGFSDEQAGTPTSVSLWEKQVGPNAFENYFLYEDTNPRKALGDSVAAYDRYMKALEYLDERGFNEVIDTEHLEVADNYLSGYDYKNRIGYDLANYEDVAYGNITPSGARFFNHQNGSPALVAVFEKPKGYDEYKSIKQPASYTRPPDLEDLRPIGPRVIKTSYEQPDIVETPPTPMPTGRQAVQIGRVAQDRENARYGQVLDKEYYWDDDLKRWQMRPVDEERIDKPFPKEDRKYRLIKAKF
tara:strand:+ start:2290 stop:3240 length:951 start_codon:yes stop_codon:yes gene_type:complete